MSLMEEEGALGWGKGGGERPGQWGQGVQGRWAGCRAPCSLPAQAGPSPCALERKRPPTSFPSPGPGLAVAGWRSDGRVPSQGVPSSSALRATAPSDGPCLTQCRSSSPESQTCFLPLPSPVLPRRPSPRARFPEMKRKKKLMMSPRCFLQPWWHSCSLRAAPRAGPGVSPCPATPGPGPILGAPAPALGSA